MAEGKVHATATAGDAADVVKPASNEEKLVLFGVDLSVMSERNRFILLAFGALFCASTFAALQEEVFRIEGFHYSGWMTVLTTATFMICAGIERAVMHDKMKGKVKDYIILSVCTFLGMYLTNWSLEYLTYPTRVMFKSSKVIPVMFASVFIVGRRYSIAEYMAAFLLVIGITMFTLADKGLPTFNIAGVFLITLGVIADAVTCNFEENRFFRNLSCSQAEVVFFSSAFGLVISVLTIWGSGELWPAIAHSMKYPEVCWYTAFFSSMGYCSVVFILLLIKGFGSTNAEIVKSCRKVFTIVLSFFLHGTPIKMLHVIGGAVFVASIVISVKLKAAKKKYAPVPSEPLEQKTAEPTAHV